MHQQPHAPTNFGKTECQPKFALNKVHTKWTIPCETTHWLCVKPHYKTTTKIAVDK